MALAHNSVWDHAFNSLHPTEDILQEVANLLSKDIFDGKSEIPVVNHLHKFNKKCLYYDIYDQGILCMLFANTFKGWIKKWFNAFTTGSIHSWEQFIQLFVFAH